MPIPTGSIAALNSASITAAFNVWKPEELNKLYQRYNDQGLSYLMLVKSLGFEKDVALDTYGHFEDGLKNPTFHALANVAAPGTGNPQNITIAPQDLDANNRFYPRLWSIVNYKNGAKGIISNINVAVPSAPVLTITPIKSTAALPAVTAGEELSISSNAHSEASGQPKSVVTIPWHYQNDCQIIKETIGVTGTELTNQTWFEIPEGNNVSYYTATLADGEYRAILAASQALLVGERSDGNITDPLTGNVIKTTEGMVPYVRRTGNIQNYTPGSFAVADFDAMAKTLDREFANSVTLNLLGIDLHNDIENSLATYFHDTNIIFAQKTANDALAISSESLAASINFKYLTKSERTFVFKRLHEFSNRETLGIEGSNYPRMGVIIPTGKKKSLDTNKLEDKIGVRYKALNGYNRRMEVWDVRGAGPGLKVTEFDLMNTYYRMNIGAHFMAGNQMILVEPA